MFLRVCMYTQGCVHMKCPLQAHAGLYALFTWPGIGRDANVKTIYVLKILRQTVFSLPAFSFFSIGKFSRGFNETVIIFFERSRYRLQRACRCERAYVNVSSCFSAKYFFRIKIIFSIFRVRVFCIFMQIQIAIRLIYTDTLRRMLLVWIMLFEYIHVEINIWGNSLKRSRLTYFLKSFLHLYVEP